MQGDLLLLDEKGAALRKLGDSLGIGTEVVSATLAADGTLFAATLLAGELTLWRSVDAGVQWQSYLVERTESACSLAASPNYSVDQQVYVGFGSRVLTPIQHTRETRSGEQRPLWRSVDLGASVAALDATRSRIVYAATSDGVEVSRDGGQHFSPLLAASGEGPTATVAVAVSPNYAHDHLVYALEIGGVLWRLEDAI
jgi:hypothetical protein